MLVLSRRKGQQIQVGPDVTITIVEVCGQTVRIGIEAPVNVNIVRTELRDTEVNDNGRADQN